jgi:hypothetical protein
MLASPPPVIVLVEPDVSDPFLIDEEGDALSGGGEGEEEEASSADVSGTVSPRDVSLSIPASASPSNISQPNLLLSPNINKDVPPPPSDSEEEEEEVPDVHLPGLVLPTMFLPIPNVRRFFLSNQLTWWLPRSLMYYTCTRRTR